MILQWSLVCGNAYKADLVQSLFMAGLFVGNLVGGAIADQRGRRPVVIINVVGVTLFSILAASPLTAPNHTAYTLWRFVLSVIETDSIVVVRLFFLCARDQIFAFFTVAR